MENLTEIDTLILRYQQELVKESNAERVALLGKLLDSLRQLQKEKGAKWREIWNYTLGEKFGTDIAKKFLKLHPKLPNKSYEDISEALQTKEGARELLGHHFMRSFNLDKYFRDKFPCIAEDADYDGLRKKTAFHLEGEKWKPSDLEQNNVCRVRALAAPPQYVLDLIDIWTAAIEYSWEKFGQDLVQIVQDFDFGKQDLRKHVAFLNLLDPFPGENHALNVSESAMTTSVYSLVIDAATRYRPGFDRHVALEYPVFLKNESFYRTALIPDLSVSIKIRDWIRIEVLLMESTKSFDNANADIKQADYVKLVIMMRQNFFILEHVLKEFQIGTSNFKSEELVLAGICITDHKADLYLMYRSVNQESKTDINPGDRLTYWKYRSFNLKDVKQRIELYTFVYNYVDYWEKIGAVKFDSIKLEMLCDYLSDDRGIDTKDDSKIQEDESEDEDQDQEDEDQEEDPEPSDNSRKRKFSEDQRCTQWSFDEEDIEFLKENEVSVTIPNFTGIVEVYHPNVLYGSHEGQPVIVKKVPRNSVEYNFADKAIEKKLPSIALIPWLVIDTDGEFSFVVTNHLTLSTTYVRNNPQCISCLVKKLKEGVEDLHKAGIAHLDIKPDNIVVGKSGKPYLIDFALAVSGDLTLPVNREVGTPGYVPLVTFSLDPITIDQFSLDVTIKELYRCAGIKPELSDSVKSLE